MAKNLIIKCKCGGELEVIENYVRCNSRCGNISHEILTKIYDNGFRKGELAKIEEIKSVLDIREDYDNGY